MHTHILRLIHTESRDESKKDTRNKANQIKKMQKLNKKHTKI